MLNKDYNNVPAFGFIDDDGYVVVEGTENGFCYKNPRMYFTEPDAICYVQEFYFLDLPDGLITNKTGDNLLEDIKKYGCGWTANEILEVCNNNKYAADVVFSLIDWQCPETKYLEILEETDEDDYDFNLINSATS